MPSSLKCGFALVFLLGAVLIAPGATASGSEAAAQPQPDLAQDEKTSASQPDCEETTSESDQASEADSEEAPQFYILTVHDLVQIALEKNYDLRVKQNEAKSAFFQYLQVAGEAGLSLNLSSSLRRSGPLAEFGFGSTGDEPVSFQKETTSTTALSASYPIAPLGNFGYGKKAAYAAYQAKEAAVEKEKCSTVTSAYNSYVAYLTAEHAQAVAEEGLALAEEQLRNAGLRFETGEAPRFEVIQGEVAVSQAMEQLVQARNGYQLARSSLFLTIGVVPEDYFHGKPVAIRYEEDLTHAAERIRGQLFPVLDSEVVAAGFVEKSPDFVSLQAGIESLHYQVKGYRRAPFITLDASYSHQSGSSMMKRNNYSFGITANLNLFDSLKTENTQRMLNEQQRAFEVQMERYRQAFRLGVRDALANLEAAIEGWQTAQHTLEQATEGLKMSRLGYQEGVVTHADLLSSRTAYLGAELNEFTQRLAVVTAYQQLLALIGITEPSEYLPAGESALPWAMTEEKEAEDDANG